MLRRFSRLPSTRTQLLLTQHGCPAQPPDPPAPDRRRRLFSRPSPTVARSKGIKARTDISNVSMLSLTASSNVSCAPCATHLWTQCPLEHSGARTIGSLSSRTWLIRFGAADWPKQPIGALSLSLAKAEACTIPLCDRRHQAEGQNLVHVSDRVLRIDTERFTGSSE